MGATVHRAMVLRTLVIVWVAGLVAGVAGSQELAPRAYLVTPIGSNAVILSYSFFDGSVLTDPTVPIQNFKARYHSAILSYYHAFNFFGRSANVTGSLPYALGNFQAAVAAVENHVYRSGRRCKSPVRREPEGWSRDAPERVHKLA